ncbi:MAG: GyrI-like domain-containing protein [Fibrobacteria bacterium]
MQIIDYKAQMRKFYKPSADSVELVDLPPMNFLMIDGQGDPNSAPAYQEAVESLFTVAYALKMQIKKSDAIDYGVMPLEGLWWAEDMSRFSVERKSEWNWTLMIHQPTPVTRKAFEKAYADVKAKKDPAALGRLRFEAYPEGRSAQKLHVGPFTEEGPVIKAVHDRIAAIGAKLRGKHHEIYLSDIRKAAPEKWKTIIRQPYI